MGGFWNCVVVGKSPVPAVGEGIGKRVLHQQQRPSVGRCWWTGSFGNLPGSSYARGPAEGARGCPRGLGRLSRAISSRTSPEDGLDRIWRFSETTGRVLKRCQGELRKGSGKATSPTRWVIGVPEPAVCWSVNLRLQVLCHAGDVPETVGATSFVVAVLVPAFSPLTSPRWGHCQMDFKDGGVPPARGYEHTGQRGSCRWGATGGVAGLGGE